MKRKIIFVILVFLLCCIFSSCKRRKDLTTQSHMKEGIQPYELTERETELLRSLNLLNKVNIVTFKAPKAARCLKVSTYILKEDCTWEENFNGQVSFGKYDSPENILEGNFTMMLEDNYSIQFNINVKCNAAYKTDEIKTDKQLMTAARFFLYQKEEIELNKEIPVAIMIYDSGRSMKTYTTDDYFTPQRFKDMDIVQAVVLKFTDEES